MRRLTILIRFGLFEDGWRRADPDLGNVGEGLWPVKRRIVAGRSKWGHIRRGSYVVRKSFGSAAPSIASDLTSQTREHLTRPTSRAADT
jgi:hypothetical protein